MEGSCVLDDAPSLTEGMQIPSFNDAAVISVNTLSFGVSISSDIKLVTLSVTKSLVMISSNHTEVNATRSAQNFA